MTLLYLSLSVFFATFALSSSLSGRTDDSSLVVNTTSGLVQGYIDNSYPSVRQFKGIPYAQPPVGDLRFVAPQPLTAASNQTIDGTKSVLACPQWASNVSTVFNTDANPGFGIDVGWAEDCLKVTVWAPTEDSCEKGDEGLPVFVWIHGGGFQNGGTEIPYEIPTEWIQRSPTHLVIGIQYRLDIFGYPNATALADADYGLNPGLLDQRAALEWIQQNVAAFGGDPNKMVSWGQSAGALSVDFLNFAYPEDPIVKGTIVSSGPATQVDYLSTQPVPATNGAFSIVAQNVGCPSIVTGASAADELACMRTVPPENIINFLQAYGDAGTKPTIVFNPIPDNKTGFANYTARYGLGVGQGLSDIPTIYGTNKDEGTADVAYPNPPTNPPNPQAVEAATLGSVQCPTHVSVDLRNQLGLKTFRYYYEGNFTDVSPRYWEGAYHSSELPQIFGTRGNFRGPATPYEIEVSNSMQDLWLAFAQDPQTAQGWVDSTTGNMTAFAEGSPGPGQAVSSIAFAPIDALCFSTGFLKPGQ